MLQTDQPDIGSELQKDLLNVQYNWNALQYDQVIWPLIRLSDEKFHTSEAWRSPFTRDGNRLHLLGTYELGRDVLTSTLYGMQKSMNIAFISVLIATLIGLPLGVASSYYSIRGIEISQLQFVLLILITLITFYGLLLGVELKYFSEILFIFILTFFVILILSNRFNKTKFIKLNPDFFLMRGIEIMKSLPLLLVLLLLLQWVNKPNMFVLALLIAIFLSVNIAKYARFITISESKENHIQSLYALGYSELRIILFHLIPKVFNVLLPLLALSLGTVVLVEASISFLGLGLPIEDISLGNIMHTARNYPAAWWVVIFPGLCVFWLVYCFQSLNSIKDVKELV
ncbi:MAG: ABC transporter permease subunit [Saprospiraceae bacterium]